MRDSARRWCGSCSRTLVVRRCLMGRIVDVTQDRVIGDPVEHTLAKIRPGWRQKPFAELLRGLMADPERLVEILRPPRRLALLVCSFDPVQEYPGLALEAAERFGLLPERGIEPVDK